MLERAPPEPDRQLAIGIAGRGFAGNLKSDSTRLRGYVTSTDLAPTILGHLGAPEPGEMGGEPVRSEGDRDVEALVSLEGRMSSIVDRRGSVIGTSALIWLAVALLVAAASRGALGRPVARMAALSAVYLPLALLVGSAVQPSEGVERLIVLLGAPLLAAVTLALLRGYRALAAACALTTLAYAVDVIAGSPLTCWRWSAPTPGSGCASSASATSSRRSWRRWCIAGTGGGAGGVRPRLAQAGPPPSSSPPASSSPSSSRPGASVPMSARRSSSRSAPRSRRR